MSKKGPKKFSKKFGQFIILKVLFFIFSQYLGKKFP